MQQAERRTAEESVTDEAEAAPCVLPTSGSIIPNNALSSSGALVAGGGTTVVSNNYAPIGSAPTLRVNRGGR